MRIWLCAICAVSVTSCEQPSKSDQRVGGLLRSDSQFLTSPDRCKISILYDNYRIELPRPNHIQNPSRMFIISGGANEAATFDLRGTFDGPSEVEGTLLFEVNGKTRTHKLVQESDGGFLVRHQDRLGTAGETSIRITVAMRGEIPANQSALLVVDSVDVAIDRGRDKEC